MAGVAFDAFAHPVAAGGVSGVGGELAGLVWVRQIILAGVFQAVDDLVDVDVLAVVVFVEFVSVFFEYPASVGEVLAGRLLEVIRVGADHGDDVILGGTVGGQVTDEPVTVLLKLGNQFTAPLAFLVQEALQLWVQIAHRRLLSDCLGFAGCWLRPASAVARL